MSETFQSFWVGSAITPYERLCLRSFVDHGHQFNLYTYSDQLNVPRGVTLKDASEFLNRNDCFAYKDGVGKGSFAACSNLFRYKLLTERGGWWVDTDVICLTDDIDLCAPFAAWEDSASINGAVLRFDAGDPLMAEALNISQHTGENAHWGEIGPRLITRLMTERGRVGEAHSPSVCYPVHYREALELLVPSARVEFIERTKPAKLLHLWNEIFRRANISKTVLPPVGSFLRELAERHPVKGWDGEYKFIGRRISAKGEDKGPKLKLKFTPLRYFNARVFGG